MNNVTTKQILISILGFGLVLDFLCPRAQAQTQMLTPSPTVTTTPVTPTTAAAAKMKAAVDAGLKPWIRCISTSNIASSGGSSLITSNSNSVGAGIGITFSIEPNNNNELSVDTYLLNGQGQKIRLIGHSEVASPGGLSTSASSALNLQNSSDSPFPMAATLTPVAGSSATSQTTLTAPTPQLYTGALTSAGLFNGQTLSQVYLQCRALLK